MYTVYHSSAQKRTGGAEAQRERDRERQKERETEREAGERGQEQVEDTFCTKTIKRGGPAIADWLVDLINPHAHRE